MESIALYRAVLFYAQGRTDEIVANATCAPRGEQGRRAFPYSIAQGRVRKIVAEATRAPRGEQGENLPCSIAGPHKEICR